MPRHDPMTGEWFFRGKWYEEYPEEAVESYGEYLIEKYENEKEERLLQRNSPRGW